jgi:hypothetical protein
VGFFDTNSLVLRLPRDVAAQNVFEGHDTWPPPAALTTFHRPAFGRVEVATNADPGLDADAGLATEMTQREADGQEMLAERMGPDAIGRPRLRIVQALGPPVGSVEVTTFPRSSTATHSRVDGQEIDPTYPRLSTAADVQVGAGAPGSVEVTTSPPPLATQRVLDGQEIPARETPGSALVTFQAPEPGSVETTTLPN